MKPGRYAVFIEPDRDFGSLIRVWKSRVNALYPNQPYANHPPHCTLWVGTIREPDAWLSRIESGLPGARPFSCRVTGPSVFFNDTLTGGHTLVFRVEPSSDLQTLQMSVARHTAEFADRTLPHDHPLYGKEPGCSAFREFGFPFVGPHWIPHFTVASLKTRPDDPLIAEFRALHFEYAFRVAGLSLWRIENDWHEPVGAVSLAPGNEKNSDRD